MKKVCFLVLVMVYVDVVYGQTSAVNEADNPTAPVVQNELGVRYYNEKNYTEAVKWYRKAAEQENAESQFNLGFIEQKKMLE